MLASRRHKVGWQPRLVTSKCRHAQDNSRHTTLPRCLSVCTVRLRRPPAKPFGQMFDRNQGCPHSEAVAAYFDAAQKCKHIPISEQSLLMPSIKKHATPVNEKAACTFHWRRNLQCFSSTPWIGGHVKKHAIHQATAHFHVAHSNFNDHAESLDSARHRRFEIVACPACLRPRTLQCRSPR